MTETEASPGLQYGMVLPVPAEIADQIKAVHQQYLVKRLQNPVHVTVVYPFHWQEDEDLLKTKIESVCQKMPPFTAVIDGVSAFPHAGVVFLRIEDSGCLKMLHLRLIEALNLDLGKDNRFRDFERENYLPHITLAADLPPDDFVTAWKGLRERAFKGEFAVSRVCLHRETSPRVWEKIECFVLQNDQRNR